MITLGITGRSGCGKSTVTAVFAAHGVPLADADQLSREILLPGSPLLPQLAARFGGEILRPDGTLNRRLLADRAFATPEGIYDDHCLCSSSDNRCSNYKDHWMRTWSKSVWL